MPGLVSGLIDTLNSQVELYNQIVELSTEKKQYIIKNDTDSLKRLVETENAVASKAAKGDKERVAIMKDICHVLNIDENEITLSKLVEITRGQPENAALSEVVEKTKKSMDAMREINEDNKALISAALEFIEFNINAIHSSFDTTAATSPYSAREDLGQGGSFLDIKG